MEPSHVDKLLERYLLLLDEYTTLRSTLENIQGAMYQNIARANFSGERGVRYGQDFYDDRMQASRRVQVTLREPDGGVPEFSTVVRNLDAEGGENVEEPGEVQENEEDEPEKAAEESDPGNQESRSKEASDAGNGSGSLKKEECEKKTKERKRRLERSRDPLRWFGLVTPTPLRFAQTQAIQLVETVVPRLASVDAEMKDVEIAVRRARKRRTKAEADSAKKNDGSSEAVASEAAQIST